MLRDVLQGFAPAYYILKVTGLLPFRIRNNRFIETPFYNTISLWLHFVIIGLAVHYSSIITLLQFIQSFTLYATILYVFIIVVNTNIVVLCNKIYVQRMQKLWMNYIHLDQLLQRYGVNVNYNRIKLLVLLMFLMQCCYKIFAADGDDLYNMHIYMVLICSTTIYHYITCSLTLYIILEKLNQEMYKKQYISGIGLTQSIVQYERIFEEICNLVENINNYFTLQLPMNILFHLTTIVHYAILIFANEVYDDEKENNFKEICVILDAACSLLSLIIPCHLCSGSNYCRICSEFFCCKSCRSQHEENHHGINPECNICIYGRALLKNPSEKLLQHFKAAHWPLHCVFCKKLFTSIEDLTLHSTCSTSQKMCDQENLNNAAIPSVSIEESYDSPPITATMHKSILTSSNKYFSGHNGLSLTTSTPMQKSNDRELLQHIPEVITPVDYSEKIDISDKLKSINATKSSVNSSEQSKNTEPPLKRRVTFSEIEIINIETPYHCRKTKRIPPSEMSLETKKEEFLHTPESTSANKNVMINPRNENMQRNIYDDSNKSNMYLTASDEGLGDTPKISTKQEHKNTYNDYIDLTNNDTTWESALMDPNVTTSEDPSSAVNPDLTESVNSPNSEILSPVVNQNLTESSILSPLIDFNLIQSDFISPIVTTAESQPPIMNFNVTKSEFLSPVVNQNSPQSENIHSRIIIVDGDFIKSEILSLVESQKLTETNISSPVLDYNLIKPQILSPVTNQNKTESDFLSSAIDCNSKILSPFTQDNLPSKILSPEMKSYFDADTENADANYVALESTIFEQGHVANITSQKCGIWSSMTNIFKTVVQGLAGSSQGGATKSSLESLHDSPKYKTRQSSSHKRSKSEIDTSIGESPTRKKIKLTHIQCRRTIRNVRPFLELTYGRKDVKTFDKWTQTE